MKENRWLNIYPLIVLVVLCVQIQYAQSEALITSPHKPLEGQSFNVTWSSCNQPFVPPYIHSSFTEVDGSVIKVFSYLVSYKQLGLGSFRFQCTSAKVSVPAQRAGEYTVQFFPNFRIPNTEPPPFDDEPEEEMVINVVKPQGVLETPANGSMQSGIGTIQGWACEASGLSFSIDGGKRTKLAYGTSRLDTADVCEDDGDNGFSYTMNWNLLEPGKHKIELFPFASSLGAIAAPRLPSDVLEARNRSISTVEFTVGRVSEQKFLRGIEAEYTLEDFPTAGKDTLIRWSTEQQNFLIINAQD